MNLVTQINGMFGTIRNNPMPRWWRLGWMNLHTYFLNRLWATRGSLVCQKSKSSSVQYCFCYPEDTCSSQSSSCSRAFTHFSSCLHCALRGSTNSSSSTSSSLGSPDPISILCSSFSPMSGCVSGLNTSSNSLVNFFLALNNIPLSGGTTVYLSMHLL